MSEPPSNNQYFPATRWTLVAKAADRDESLRNQALEELCQIYWAPIYAYIGSKGHSQAQAEDLTQGFFARFLSRRDFEKATPERGKLRSYLLTAVQNYMRNDWRKNNQLKRGGGAIIASLDIDPAEVEYKVLEPSDDLTPEKIFERQWALTLLAQVMTSLRARYQESGKSELFEALKKTINQETPAVSYQEIGTNLGMTEGAVKVAVHRLKKRYAKLLRETIADTLTEGEDIDDELRHLRSVFS